MATPADFERIGNYAIMYNGDKNIDRSKSTRTVPMSVLCLGYSRTGTLTMHSALTTLGYPTYHFSSGFDNVRDYDMWNQAMDAKFNGKGPMPDKKFFDGLLGHIGAVTDSPCNLFGEELLEFYPDAKVVLVQRNVDSWYKSWVNYCTNAYSPLFPFLGIFDPSWTKRIISAGAAITQIQAGFSDTFDQAKVRSRRAYEHHYRDVREMVPSDRLLEFNLKDGWEPLCKFLGKEIPKEPFPHKNDGAANSQMFAELGQLAIKRILMNGLKMAVVIGVPVGLLCWRVLC